jgi:hypothetical protein
LTSLPAAYSDPPASAAASAPAGVVLRLHNGSVVRPAVLLDVLEMETKLGKLSIPAAEVRRIDFGFRLTDDETKKLTEALADLGAKQYLAREAARKKLTAMGRLAYPGLRATLKGADLEVSKRVQGILKEIEARVPAERLQSRTTDLVRTTDSLVAGRITSTSLRVQCEVFGEVKIPVPQLRDLRSLLPGGDLSVAVDSSRYGNKTSWLETEFEVTTGTKLEIKATGLINLDPNNTLGGNINARNVRPSGTQGLVSGEGFIPGQLLGRIGLTGPIFVIGSQYVGSPVSEGKLYLRIVTIEHANNIKAEGSYQVRISAEPN